MRSNGFERFMWRDFRYFEPGINNLFYDDSKCYPTLFVVFKAEGAAVEADDLARDGKADA